MSNPFFEFFDEDRPILPKDKSLWPDSLKKISYKTYPRNKRVMLPKAELGQMSLEEAIYSRKSDRSFSNIPIDINLLSSILFFGCGIIKPGQEKEVAHRAHPSGGARFPIELYFIAINVEGLKRGIYHYNVWEHSAEFLADYSEEDLRRISRYDFVASAAVIFIFTMIPERSMTKYGNSGLKVGLIEAGHLAENIYLVCSASHLKCCVVAGIKDKNLVNRLLDIDGIEEVPFYLMAAGR